MGTNEFLITTSQQLHNTLIQMLPEVAENFMIAIYILEILFYLVLFTYIFKFFNWFIGGRSC